MTSVIPSNTRKPRDEEIDVHGLTHAGKVRAENQDHFLLASIHKRVQVLATNLGTQEHLPSGEQRVAFIAMVADGVGGEEGGAEASATALEAVMQYVNDSMSCLYDRDVTEDKFAELLQRCAIQSHEAIRARARENEDHATMATTLTLFMGVWPAYYLVQVGDSRYYLWRDGKLTQVTRDQTLAEELVDQGILSRAQAPHTQFAHVLSSALGASAAEPVVTRLRAEWDNVHLLCSDGLTKHVSDERIAERLANMTSAKDVCEQLLQDALDDGGTDNITIIVGRGIPKE
ncbi:MAG TPA: protein phosphatase 2C domain-containing protein [Gemmatimonadaceae bacterium]|jgi:protein phosphatase|nr:protein phosphatase 2C domain-containing protein [Gemmatimonadaceae bacterium]